MTAASPFAPRRRKAPRQKCASVLPPSVRNAPTGRIALYDTSPCLSSCVRSCPLPHKCCGRVAVPAWLTATCRAGSPRGTYSQLPALRRTCPDCWAVWTGKRDGGARPSLIYPDLGVSWLSGRCSDAFSQARQRLGFVSSSKDEAHKAKVILTLSTNNARRTVPSSAKCSHRVSCITSGTGQVRHKALRHGWPRSGLASRKRQASVSRPRT